MEPAIQQIDVESCPVWRVVSGSKVIEAADMDDAFMQADFAFMDGASRVVIECIKGKHGGKN